MNNNCGLLYKILSKESVKNNKCLMKAIRHLFEASEILYDAFNSFSSKFNGIYSNKEIFRRQNPIIRFDNDEFIQVFEDVYNNKEIDVTNNDTKTICDICMYGIRSTNRLINLLTEYITNTERLEDSPQLDVNDLSFLSSYGIVMKHINNTNKHDLALLMTCVILYDNYKLTNINISKIMQEKYVC